MTAALESLHRQFPGTYQTDVDTTCNALFDHNPWVTKLADARPVQMDYPLIHQCNQRPVHFLQGYVEHLGAALGIDLRPQVNRPFLYLSDDEKGWLNQVSEATGYKGKFWLVCSGVKSDYTVKGWGRHNYQAVVNALVGEVQFVQVGESGHNHPPLDGVINLVGKTDLRQLVRLAWNAQGGLGGVSFLHHVFAALEKPFVTLASGMEPTTWERYNTGAYLTRQGQLPCCASGGCWKSRTVKLGDGDGKDDSLCSLPVLGAAEAVPKCLAMIRPDEVVEAVRGYYRGGLLTH